MEEDREYNNFNFIESQVLILRKYNDFHTSNQRAFVDFVKKEKNYSSSYIRQKKLSQRNRTFAVRLSGNKPEIFQELLLDQLLNQLFVQMILQ